MNTPNVSFQFRRLLFSRVKARLFPAAILFCLLASPGWAQVVPSEIVPEDTIWFRGSLVSQEAYQDFAAPPIAHLLFFVTGSGSARATDIGAFTVIYAGMTDYTGGAGQQCARFISAAGDYMFTTAIVQVTTTRDPNVVSIREFHTVTGGTGEYAHVTGSFSVQRLINYAADGLSGTGRGTFNGF